MIEPFWSELKRSGLRFVDIGCRGDLDLSAVWHPLVPVMHYAGFDADPEEIARREKTPHPFLSRTLFATAVSGSIGEADLFITRSPACSSLLPTREEWNKRFLGSSFEEIGRTSVRTTTLDHLAETKGLQADVLKIDSQGMEVPILEASERLLSTSLFAVEVETGLQPNYVNETTFDKASAFLLSRGFLPFDVQVHRWRRQCAIPGVGRGQMLFAESLWLRDYLSERTWGIAVPAPDRNAAVRALAICWAGGFGDYGVELADYFTEVGLLTSAERDMLRSPAAWRGHPAEHRLGGLAVRLLPNSVRRWLADVSAASANQASVWAALRRRLLG